MITSNTHIVFDLDDTLYKEIDFVKSAYSYINNYIYAYYNLDLSEEVRICLDSKINFYEVINSKLPPGHCLTIDKYLELYRFHFPDISLSTDTINFLNKLKAKKIDFSIITDGRSISQRNKIRALGLDKEIKNFIISEETGSNKPQTKNFELIEKQYPKKKLVYIADNPKKDFLAPNSLNWHTICLLDNGFNIHKQDFSLDNNYLPKTRIKFFKEIDL